jgi:hypothetical protein
MWSVSCITANRQKNALKQEGVSLSELEKIPFLLHRKLTGSPLLLPISWLEKYSLPILRIKGNKYIR